MVWLCSVFGRCLMPFVCSRVDIGGRGFEALALGRSSLRDSIRLKGVRQAA